MNRRSFIKRTGLLSCLAILNPLRFLGLFKPKPALSMETMLKAFDECEANGSLFKDGDDFLYVATPGSQWESFYFNEHGIVEGMSYWNGKQWIPMED